MSPLTVFLLCLIGFTFSFWVTHTKRSLTDITAMGKRYRRHNKVISADALEVIITDSGNTALKVDALGSKDYVAIHLTRKEIQKFKAAFEANEGIPVNVSLRQYKIGKNQYYSLYDADEKKAPVEMESQDEEKLIETCRTARHIAPLLYIFSFVLNILSLRLCVGAILLATLLIYINIPFLPDDRWKDECETISKPKQDGPKKSNVPADVVVSAASVTLQNIREKYAESATTNEQIEKLDEPDFDKLDAAIRVPELTEVELNNEQPESEDVAEDLLEVDLDDAQDISIAEPVNTLESIIELDPDPEDDGGFANETPVELAAADAEDIASLEAELNAAESEKQTFDPIDLNDEEYDEPDADINELFDMNLLNEIPEESSADISEHALPPIETPKADEDNNAQQTEPVSKADAKNKPVTKKKKTSSKKSANAFTKPVENESTPPSDESENRKSSGDAKRQEENMHTETRTREDGKKESPPVRKVADGSDDQIGAVFGRQFRGTGRKKSASAKTSKAKKASSSGSETEQISFNENDSGVIKC